MIFFPLVNLLGLATGAACICLTAHQCAIQAATQQRYDNALDAMQQEASNMVQSGFGRFARLNAIGGYNNCGADLFVVATEFRAKQISTYGPNKPVPPPIDTLDNVYECTSKVTYDVGPAISMSGVPWFDKVPGLGVPARISMSASRAAEYPEGLEAARSVANLNATPTSAKPAIPWSEADNPNGSAWNYPKLYDFVASNGQTVVNEDVIQVYADNPNWTATPLEIKAGSKIWIDYRADGQWSIGNSLVNADGIADDLIGSIPRGSLIGKLGNGSEFRLGKQQWNFVPPGTGPLFLMCKDQPDAYTNNKGRVNVRIIVSQ